MHLLRVQTKEYRGVVTNFFSLNQFYLYEDPTNKYLYTPVEMLFWLNIILFPHYKHKDKLT